MKHSGHQRSPRTAARLMLLLTVVQFLFVSFEAADMIHGTTEDTFHHQSEQSSDNRLSADHDHSVNDTRVATTDQFSEDATPTPGQDNCDHCCHCHGHGTHFSLVSIPHPDIPVQSPRLALTSLATALSSLPDSIHRPPIV